MTDITPQEYAIYDEISRLGASLWESSKKIVGLNSDPKMTSVMLFKRLWSNHRGYTLLHNNSLPLESDIILRSGVENAICIAANYRLREEFTVLIQMDVLATTLGQIKTNREDVPDDLLRDQETFIRNVTAKLPEGKKPAYLNWKKLAELGQVPQLYKDYRTLSSGSAHVTGMSIIRGVVDADGAGLDTQDELNNLEKRLHLMMMAGTTLLGSCLHSRMIEDNKHAMAAEKLKNKLNEISKHWL